MPAELLCGLCLKAGKESAANSGFFMQSVDNFPQNGVL